MDKIRLISLPILLLLLTSISATYQRTYTPGVAAGDNFTYEMYGVYTSDIPNILSNHYNALNDPHYQLYSTITM